MSTLPNGIMDSSGLARAPTKAAKYLVSTSAQKDTRYESLCPKPCVLVPNVENRPQNNAVGSHIWSATNVERDQSFLRYANAPPTRPITRKTRIVNMHVTSPKKRSFTTDAVSVSSIMVLTDTDKSGRVKKNPICIFDSDADTLRSYNDHSTSTCIASIVHTAEEQTKKGVHFPDVDMKGKKCCENQNVNAEKERFRRQPASGTATFLNKISRRANELSNYSESPQSQHNRNIQGNSPSSRPNRSPRHSSDGDVDLTVMKLKNPKNYHESCRASMYQIIPQRPISRGSNGEKPKIVPPTLATQVKTRVPEAPLAATSTSKYHALCQRSFHQMPEKKVRSSFGKPVPYGGPQHAYACPKRSIINVYDARLMEKAFVAAYRKMLRKYNKIFCAHCSAAYADGLCRGHCAKKNSHKKKPKADEKKNSKEGTILKCTDQDQTPSTHECTCPDSVDPPIGYRYVVQTVGQDRAHCTITVSRETQMTDKVQSMRLLIVEVDLLHPSTETKNLSVVSNAESTTDLACAQNLHSSMANSDNSDTELENKKETMKKNLSPVLQNKLGSEDQYSRLAAREININMNVPNAKFSDTISIMGPAPKFWSDCTKELGCPIVLKGRKVTDACFCPRNAGTLLTLHTKQIRGKGNLPYRLLCMWSILDLRKPTRILTGVDNITCMCFSPISAAYVLAGSCNGSVMIWDTENPYKKQRTVKVNSEYFSLSCPIYSTSDEDLSQGHSSPVLSMVGVKPQVRQRESISGEKPQNTYLNERTFQVATVDARGIIILWQVAEPAHEMSLCDDTWRFETDSNDDTGNIKLVMTLQISLIQCIPGYVKDTPLGTLVLQLNTTSINQKVHSFLAKSGSLGHPTSNVQYCVGACIGKSSVVQCLAFSPFENSLFLAGCQDGKVFLCHQEKKDPVKCFSNSRVSRRAVEKIEWSLTRPGVFFALHKNSCLRIYDLVIDREEPIFTVQHKGDHFLTMALSSGTGHSRAPQSLFLSTTKGKAEIHILNESLTHTWDVNEAMLLRRMMEKVPSTSKRPKSWTS